MRIKRTAIISVLAVILALVTCITAAAAVTIPSPTSEFYVYDGANIIARSTEKYIIEKNRKLETKTGGQIVIVTVDSTGDVPISEYANTIYTQWKIGDEEKFNGLLLLLSVDEEDYWVTFGSGIQNRFSAENVKTMTDNYLAPYYLVKQYDKSVRTIFDKFLSSFEKMYSIDVEATETGEDQVEAKTDGKSSSEVVTTVVVILLVVLFIALAIYVLRKYNEAEKRAQQRQRQRQQQARSQGKRRNPSLGQTYLPNGQTQKQSSRPRKPQAPRNGRNRPTGRRQG